MLSLLNDTPRTGSMVDWYLVFSKSQTKNWMTKLLHPEFGHLKMLRFDGYNWIMVDGRMDAVDIFILPYSKDHSVHDIVKDGRILWISRWRPDRVRTPWIFAPATCVEAVKAALGIRKFWIWTPRQLYKYLGGKDG